MSCLHDVKAIDLHGAKNVAAGVRFETERVCVQCGMNIGPGTITSRDGLVDEPGTWSGAIDIGLAYTEGSEAHKAALEFEDRAGRAYMRT